MTTADGPGPYEAMCAAMDADGAGRAKPLLVALARSAPKVYPSPRLLAERTGVTERTVRDRLDDLEGSGLVEVYERHRGGRWELRPDAGKRDRGRRPLWFVLRLPGLPPTQHPGKEAASDTEQGEKEAASDTPSGEIG